MEEFKTAAIGQCSQEFRFSFKTKSMEINLVHSRESIIVKSCFQGEELLLMTKCVCVGGKQYLHNVPDVKQ